MDNDSKIVIPDDVVNPKEYRVMLALQKHPILLNNIYIASDGTEVNIAMLPQHLKKRIEHLSPTEQENILELKRKYNTIRGKISAAKAVAYGRAGRLGSKARETELKRYQLSPFQEDIIELLGRMFTTQEVVKIMVEENGIECTEDDVKTVFKDNLVEREKKREEFRNKVADVRLYNKRPRLEELAWMYGKMKMRYLTLNSVDCYNAMLRTLEQIRKESEGDVLTVNGILDVNIEVGIQAQIQKEIFKTINLKEIILGRVAARMNFDPARLLAGLHNSVYAKFVDISGMHDDKAVMEYPSNSAYDFAAIEQNAEAEAIDITAQPVTEEEHSSATNIKELLLAKIRKQKKDMESRQMRWDDLSRTRDEETPEEEKPIKRSTGRAYDKKLKSTGFKEKKKKNKPDYK